MRQTYAQKRYFPPLSEEACVIPEAPVTGELFELLGSGEPIDPLDASKGCAIGGTEHSPGGELIVARYDLEGEARATKRQREQRPAVRCAGCSLRVRSLREASGENAASGELQGPDPNRALSSTQLSARAESRKDVIDGSVSFDGVPARCSSR